MRTFASLLLAALAFVATALVVGAVMFVLVLLVAGPHADLVATDLRGAVLGLAWLVAAVVPALVAIRVFRRGRSARARLDSGAGR